MLAHIETSVGLTVVSPTGEKIRIARQDARYLAAKQFLGSGEPAAAVWRSIAGLVSDPLKSIRMWVERYSLSFDNDVEHISFQGLMLKRIVWEPFLNKMVLRGHSAFTTLNIIRSVQETAGLNLAGLDLSTCCFIAEPRSINKFDVVAYIDDMPGVSDYYNGHLVTAKGEYTEATNSIVCLPRNIIQKLQSIDKLTADKLLKEPLISGTNSIFRCEEGSELGWIPDLSFDDLASAILVRNEIEATGADARIVNSLTNVVLSV